MWSILKEEIPRYLVRQQVRPGCTGWAQIHGLRGDTDIAERIRYDIWYIGKLDRGAGHQDHLPHRVRRQDGQRRKNYNNALCVTGRECL